MKKLNLFSLATAFALSVAVAVLPLHAAPSSLEKAQAAYDEGELETAIAALDKILAEAPDNLAALKLMGQSQLEMGEFEKALVALEKAFQQSSKDYKLLSTYLNAMEMAEKGPERLPVLKALFELNHSDLVTSLKYLKLMEEHPESTPAADLISLLEALTKSSKETIYREKLAVAYEKSGQHAKAEALYRDLIANDPESGEYWSGLAFALLETNPKKAKEPLEKAMLFSSSAEKRETLKSKLLELEGGEKEGVAAKTQDEKTPTNTTPSPTVAKTDNNVMEEAAREAAVAKKAVEERAAQEAAAAQKALEDKAAEELAARQSAEEKAAAEKLAAEKLAAEKLAAEKLAAEKAQAKAEAERLAKARADSIAAAEKAASEMAVKQGAEEKAAQEAAAAKKAADEQAAAELAAKQSAEEKAAAEKLAAEKAQAKAEAERLAKARADSIAAAEKAASDMAAKQAAQEQAAAELAAKQSAEEKAAAEKLAAEKLAAEKLAAEKLAAEKLAAEKLAAEKLAAEKLAAEKAQAKAEAERLAKARADSIADAKAEAERVAREREKARLDGLAAAKAEAVRIAKARADSVAAAEKAAQEAAAAKKAAEEKAAAELAARKAAEEKAAAEKLAAEKAEAKAEAERLAKARADSIAAAKAEAERVAREREKARQDSLAAAKAEAVRIAKARADSVAAAEKAAQEAAAAKKAAEEKAAAELAARKAAEEKAAAEKLAAEKAEAKAEAERLAKARADSIAAAKAEAERVAREREKARQDSLAAVKAAEEKFQQDLAGVLKGDLEKLDLPEFTKQLESRLKRQEDARLWQAKGTIHFKQGDYQLAAQSLAKVALPDADVRTMLALSHFEGKSYQKAAEHFSKLPSVSTDEAMWKKYIHALVESGKKLEAAEEYEKLLVKQPRDQQALSFLESFYRQPLQKEKLVRVLERKLDTDTKNSGLLKELASLHGEGTPKGSEYLARYFNLNPQDTKAGLKTAQALEGQGKIDEALKLYARIAGSHAADFQFHRHWGALLESQNRTKDAIIAYGTAYSLKPEKELGMKLAGLHEKVEEPSKAIELYRSVLQMDPKNQAAIDRLLALVRESDDKPALKQALELAVESDPKDHAALFELARVSYQSGDKRDAYEYLIKAIKLQPSKKEYLEALPMVLDSPDKIREHAAELGRLSAVNSDPKIQLLHAQSLVLSDKKGQAADIYTEIFRKEPELLQSDRAVIILLHEQGKFPAAGDLADRYLAKQKDTGLLEVRAESFMKSNRPPQEQLKAIESLLASGQAKGDWHRQAAQLAERLGDEKKALQSWRSWLATNPGDKEANLKVYRIVKGDKDHIDAYSDVLGKLINLDPANQGQYLNELVAVKLQLQDSHGAMELLEKIANREPRNHEILFRIGDLAIKTGDKQKAKSSFEKAYSQLPSNPEYARKYGELLLTETEFRANLKLFELLRNHNPTLDETIKLAKALSLNGNHMAAAIVWKGIAAEDAALVLNEPLAAESFVEAKDWRNALPLLERQYSGDRNNAELVDRLMEAYKAVGNRDKYLEALTAAARLQPDRNGNLLKLARQLKEAGKQKESLKEYYSWAMAHPDDGAALTEFHALAEQASDTTMLEAALKGLNDQAKPDKRHVLQMAELQYRRYGNIQKLEAAVQSYPDFERGRSILVKEFASKRNLRKLASLEPQLAKEAQQDPTLLEPLGDVYAQGTKKSQANQAYLQWLQSNKQSKPVFEKVYGYAKETKSSTLPEVLGIGIKAFPKESVLKRELAGLEGDSPKALALHEELADEGKRPEDVKAAARLAKKLGRNQAAAKWYGEWARQDGNSIEAWENVFQLAGQMGDQSLARQALEKLVSLKPQDRELRLQLAKSATKNGDHELGRNSYLEAFRLKPDDYAVEQSLYDLIQKMPEKEQQRPLELIVQLRDAAHYAHFRLAKSALEQKNREKAYGHINKALKYQPKNEEYLLTLPWTIAKDEEIQQHFGQLVSIAARPDVSSYVHYLVARGYSAQSKPKEAAAHWLMVHSETPERLAGKREPILDLYAAGRHDLAGALAEQYLVRDDRDTEIRKIQLDALEKAGKPKELRDALSRYLAVSPSDLQWRFRLAELDVKAGDTSAAIENMRKWIQLEPEGVKGYKFLLPLVSQRKQDQETYLVVLEKLVRLDQANADEYESKLGLLQYEKGNFSEAYRLLSKQADDKSVNAELHYKLGLSASRLQKPGGGKEHFSKAYRMDSDKLTYARTYGQTLQSDTEIKASLQLFEFLDGQSPSVDERRKHAKSLLLNGKHAEAAKAYDWFKESEPDLVLQEPAIAEAYLKAGRKSDALALYEKLAVSRPDRDVYETLVGLYAEKKDKAKYESSLERLVQADPGYKDYQLKLAQAKKASGKPAEAIRLYDEWTRRNPKDIGALDAYLELAEGQRDTAQMVEALERLNKLPKTTATHEFQLAELKFRRTGDISELEKFVVRHKTHDRARELLVREYHKRRNFDNLARHKAYLSQASEQKASLKEVYGDLLATQKQSAAANDVYFEWLTANAKDRKAFEKVYTFGKDFNSPHLTKILALGYEAFPSDRSIQMEYASRLGRTEKALQIYEAIIKADAGNALAAKEAARTAKALKNRPAAVLHYEHWSKLEPHEKEVWVELAKLYEAEKNQDKLIIALERLSGFEPQDHALAFRLGNLLMQKKRVPEAINGFRKAAEANPKEAKYHRALGMAYYISGKRQDAKIPLLQAEKLSKYDEDVVAALYEIFSESKEEKEAAERLEKLAAHNPGEIRYVLPMAKYNDVHKKYKQNALLLENPAIKEKLNDELSFLLLNAFLKEGKKKEGLALAEKLLNVYPQKAYESLPMAILFYENEKRRNAQKILDMLVRKSPSNEAFYYHGRVSFDGTDYKQAAQSLERGKEHDKDAYLWLGKTYEQLKENKRAIEAFEVYFEKSGDIKGLELAYPLYKMEKDKAGLKRVLERLVQKHPDNLDYRGELGVAYLQAGQQDLALQQFEAVLKKNSMHPLANLHVGMEEAKSKRYGKAMIMLQRGLKAHPEYPEAWRLLGEGYLARKNSNEALDSYRKAFQLDTTHLPTAEKVFSLVRTMKRGSELEKASSDVIKLDSAHADAGKVLAALRFEQKNWKDAAAIYRHLVRKDEKNQAAWENFGFSLLELKEIPEAKKALQQAIYLGGETPKLVISLARIHKEDKNLDQAEVLLKKLLDKNDSYHLAHFWLGEISMSRHQAGVAEGHYKNALKHSPTDPEYAVALAKLYYGQGDHTQALAILTKVQNRLDRDGKMIFADCLLKEGKEDQARITYTDLYEEQPTAVLLARLANLHLERNDDAMAMQIIDKSEFKDAPEVRLVRAKSLVAQRKTDQARDLIKLLIREDRRNADFYYLLGMSYYRENDWGKSRKYFEKALTFNHDMLDAVNHIGLCLLREGKVEDSRKYFKELSQRKEDNWRAKGYLGLAMVFAQEKKPEAVENYIMKSLQFDQTAEASVFMAKTALDQKKTAEAEKWARKALRIRSDYAPGMAVLADILLAQKRTQEALTLTKDALAKDPSSCELNIGFAKVNMEAGNYKLSEDHSQYAIELCPEEPEPYLYSGIVAHKAQRQKDAKRFFKDYRRRGGNESALPVDYR